jgi:hypothetical protein
MRTMARLHAGRSAESRASATPKRKPHIKRDLTMVVFRQTRDSLRSRSNAKVTHPPRHLLEQHPQASIEQVAQQGLA